MSTTRAGSWRELARRAGNDVEVTLLWHPLLNRVKVAVSDGRTCQHLDFQLGAGDAVRAFHEPFTDATTQLHAMTDEFWGFNPSERQTANEEGLS